MTGVIAVRQTQPAQPKESHAVLDSAPAPATPSQALWPQTAAKVPSTNAASWNLLKNDFIKRFEKQLELTHEQTARIEVIITESQKRTKAISDQMAPQLREEVRHTRELVRAELTADQRKKFEELLKRPNRRAADLARNGTNVPSSSIVDNPE